MDWEKLGLKMGLEIHQQLNTKHKLFCPCKTELVDEDYNEIVPMSYQYEYSFNKIEDYEQSGDNNGF